MFHYFWVTWWCLNNNNCSIIKINDANPIFHQCQHWEREKRMILFYRKIGSKRTKSYRFEDNFSFHDDTDDDSMRITSRIPPNTGFTSCFICDEKGNGNQIEQMQFFFRFLYTHRWCAYAHCLLNLHRFTCNDRM